MLFDVYGKQVMHRVEIIPGKTYTCGCQVMENRDGWTWSPESRSPPMRVKCRVHGGRVACEEDVHATDAGKG